MLIMLSITKTDHHIVQCSVSLSLLSKWKGNKFKWTLLCNEGLAVLFHC